MKTVELLEKYPYSKSQLVAWYLQYVDNLQSRIFANIPEIDLAPKMTEEEATQICTYIGEETPAFFFQFFDEKNLKVGITPSIGGSFSISVSGMKYPISYESRVNADKEAFAICVQQLNQQENG